MSIALDFVSMLNVTGKHMRTSEQIVSAERLAFERANLRSALVDIMSDGDLWTIDELRDAVRDDWGDTSDGEIGRQLRELVRDGFAVYSGDTYAMADRVEEVA